MRTFIAIEMPEEIRQKVGDYIDSISGMVDNIKWVAPENLHFTIKFIGEVNKSDLRELMGCIETTASEFTPFSMGLYGLGFFPSEIKPRVVWIGADGGADHLLEVFQTLENCLEKVGYDRDSRTFSPHLTIGRAKKDKNVVVPEGLPEFEPVRFEISSIALIKSTLTPQGPIYEKTFESKLTHIE
ncbi:MAG: RNA 2',3'-cyclic phosphodiesterase [Candidatus Latescibacteria bacterium]|nr:RNA 2',3'-cyclic phosphodiesterase [Candidatus Latescibacterota bacterium]